jgi:hypothetical protein
MALCEPYHWQKNNPYVIVAFAILRGEFANYCHFCQQLSGLTMTTTTTFPLVNVADWRQSRHVSKAELAQDVDFRYSPVSADERWRRCAKLCDIGHQ